MATSAKEQKTVYDTYNKIRDSRHRQCKTQQ